MPNCDWGRPCSCIECRTIYHKIICPNCSFSNTIEILRNVNGYSIDRKGLEGYDFSIPTEPIKDLQCYKCGYLIEKVGYYTEISLDSCKQDLEREKAIEDGKVCSKCNTVEGFDYCFGVEKVKLKIKDGVFLCQKCLSEIVKKETPDPSNENEKYVFDEKESKWKLNKIKKECVDCGKKRWLNVENQWKTQCINCYRKIKTP
jgi:hypothetical protein